VATNMSSRCDVYFIPDNSYAKRLLESLVKYLKDRGLAARSISTDCSQPANKCSSSMYNYINAAVDKCRYIVILVDSERESPESVRRDILEKHVRGLNVDSSRIKVIVATPCLEEWLCKLIALRGSKPEKCSGDSCEDFISAIQGVLGDVYEKKMLPSLFMKYFSGEVVEKCSDRAYKHRLPSSLCELLELLRRLPH
jgi:hypothetical protein